MTADANRAEAMNCLDRAREAIRSGNATFARKMLNKAKSMDPTQDISYLMSKVDALGAAAESSTSGHDSEDRSYAHDDHYEESNLRSRRPHRSPGRTPQQQNGNVANSSSAPKSRSSSRTPKLGVDYTKEQLETVERIRHCKDYYEILKLSKTASDADIKKEYRKLALQLHPDKCKAPHSTEAFKALGSAYAILSDPQKRKQYDEGGSEAVSHPSRRRGDFFEYDYAHGFDADFSPEEIFNMFFGGGYPGEAVHRRRQRFNRSHTRQDFDTHDQNGNPLGPLLQLLPLIAVLVLGIVAQLMVGDPPFSLNQTGKYNVKRFTSELKIPYYVRSDFDQTYRGRFKQVENQVEDEYLQQLRMNCYKEQNQRETLLYRARWQRDEELIRRAERMSMPSCNRLKEIYQR